MNYEPVVWIVSILCVFFFAMYLWVLNTAQQLKATNEHLIEIARDQDKLIHDLIEQNSTYRATIRHLHQSLHQRDIFDEAHEVNAANEDNEAHGPKKWVTL